MALAILGGCQPRIPPPIEHARGYVAGRPPVIVYVVREGDTLFGIGRRFGLDPLKIARRNGLSAPYRILVGQKLRLHLAADRVNRRRTARASRSARSASHAKASVRVDAQRSRRVMRSAHKPARASPPARKARNLVRRKQVAKTAPSARRGLELRAARPSIRLIWPVRGTVTSRFGRRHGRPHDGIDIAAPRGTPVKAAADGVVVYADHRLTGYGNLIILRHAGDVFTAYAHNQRNLVRRGQRVRQGQTIALVGASGRATGPHLHFELRIGAQPVDPLAYLPRD